MNPEYDHNRLLSLNADGDKDTSLQLGVYMGNASLVMFSNRSLAAKFNLDIAKLHMLKRGLRNALEFKPGEKLSMNFSRWDQENKKQVPQGSLFIGRDDKGIIYLGVSAPGTSAKKFLVRSSLGFDLSDPMTDVQRSDLQANAMIDAIDTLVPMSMALTMFKREQPTNRAGGGGNRGHVSAGSDGGDVF